MKSKKIKPKPKIERISLTEEDKEDIKNILDGLPRRETIERVKAKGWNVEN